MKIIICFIMAAMFEVLGMHHISQQILMLGIWWTVLVSRVDISQELMKNGYPENRCSNLKKSKIWGEIKNGTEKMPNENIKIIKFSSYGFFIFSFLSWSIGIIFPKSYTFFSDVYIVSTAFVVLILTLKAFKIAFFEKFKRISIYNWRYIFGCSKFENVPQRIKVGKCKIVEEKKVFRKKYFIVRTVKSGKMYEKVLFCGEGNANIEKVYMLYEICGVKYMI